MTDFREKLIRYNRRSTAFSFNAMLFFFLAFALVAFSDKFLHLGWEFHWKDIWGSLGLAAFVFVVYALIRVIFRILDIERS